MGLILGIVWLIFNIPYVMIGNSFSKEEYTIVYNKVKYECRINNIDCTNILKSINKECKRLYKVFWDDDVYEIMSKIKEMKVRYSTWTENVAPDSLNIFKIPKCKIKR